MRGAPPAAVHGLLVGPGDGALALGGLAVGVVVDEARRGREEEDALAPEEALALPEDALGHDSFTG